MKRNLIIMALIALCLSAYNCGGGGAGTANVPAGENSSLPSEIQLLPVQYVAQTGSYIYITAKVLDGNGMPVPNTTVTFTNLSGTGVLSPAGSSGAVSATTDSLGKATATLYSTVQNFVTVQASVATTTSPAAPAAQITSKKTVYYSSYYLQCESSSYIYIYGSGCTQATTSTPTTTASPYMLFYVDGNSNGTYNESSDYTLFESASDNQVNIRAIVYDGTGGVVKNTTVTFGADTDEVAFPNNTAKTVTTDSNGQANILVQVTPATTRTVSTVANITASTTGGAAGLVSLYLNPVTIASISVTATPTTVAKDGSAKIIAAVKTSAGSPAPDGTSVNFVATCGAIGAQYYIDAPFAQTVSGSASANFTGPSENATCTITATSGGLSNTVTVTVYTAATATTTTIPDLSISPGSVTVASSASAQTVTFNISGGTSPYTTTSTDPTKAYNTTSGNGVWSGSTVTVTIPANAGTGTITMNVYDSNAKSKTATLTIMSTATTGQTVTLSPSTITVSGIYNNASGGATENPTDNSDNVVYYVTGGTSPYTMYSSNTSLAPKVTVTSTSSSSGTFTIDPTSVSASTDVTLTVSDATGATKAATITVSPYPATLAVNPSSAAIASGTSTTFYIIGGTGPFNVVSGYTQITISNAACTTVTANYSLSCPAGTTSFTVTTTGLLTIKSDAITVVDTTTGKSAQAGISVN